MIIDVISTTIRCTKTTGTSRRNISAARVCQV